MKTITIVNNNAYVAVTKIERKVVLQMLVNHQPSKISDNYAEISSNYLKVDAQRLSDSSFRTTIKDATIVSSIEEILKEFPQGYLVFFTY
jgi:hypothetical protein